VDAHERVGVVDRAREHASELCSTHPRLEGRDLRSRFGDDAGVALGRPQIEQNAGVVHVARQLLDARDLLLQPRALAGDDLGLFLVVPESRRERLKLESADFCLQLRQVKDAPLAP
jgi:hypothetical protein